jgi:hypothetical protein
MENERVAKCQMDVEAGAALKQALGAVEFQEPCQYRHPESPPRSYKTSQPEKTRRSLQSPTEQLPWSFFHSTRRKRVAYTKQPGTPGSRAVPTDFRDLYFSQL